MSVIAAVLGYKQPQLIHQILTQFGEKNIVLIDNGSPEPLQFPIPTLRFHENKLFTGGWVQAMPFLMGYDYVFMLNSDVIGITLDTMLRLYTTAVSLQVDAISPTFNSPHYHMQPQSSKVDVRRVNWLDWCAVMVSTKWWREIGGFDPRYLGYGADIQICKRGRDAGKSGFFVVDSLNFKHLGSVTAFNEGKIELQSNVGEMNRLLAEDFGVKDWTQCV